MAPDRNTGSPFEQIRHSDDDGNEYWSARDLALVLGYSGWQRFQAVIARARVACENSGQNPEDHFNLTVKMIGTGKGAERGVEDWHLSRYACYLIVQNADPNKEIVALGQTYFAIQTHRQELADQSALAEMDEEQQRLYVRDELKKHNKHLAATATTAGVQTAMDFAIFQDHGYRGLYGGIGARDIHARKGLKKSQQILDHMGSTELAANLFRATQTEEKLRRDNIQGRVAANNTHRAVGREVRETIRRLGGTMPEDLPTPETSIQQLERKHKPKQPALQPPEPPATAES